MGLVISRRKTVIVFLSTAAFLLAFFKPFGLSPDYLQYELFFDDLRQDFLNVVSSSRFEPAFVFISSFLVWFLRSNGIIYAIFVFASIWVKLTCGTKDAVGMYFWLAVVFYFFKYFPLHELNQLRAALGAAMAVAAFLSAEQGRRRLALLIGCIGILFHYSVLILLPFIFLRQLGRMGSVLLALGVYASFSIFIVSLQELATKYFSVFQLYEAADKYEKGFNRFSPVFFPEFFVIGFSLYYWKDLTSSMQRVVSLQLVGFSLLYAFADVGVVAVRTHELFSVLWIFYVAHMRLVRLRIKTVVLVFALSSIAVAVYLFFIGDFFDSGHA